MQQDPQQPDLTTEAFQQAVPLEMNPVDHLDRDDLVALKGVLSTQDTAKAAPADGLVHHVSAVKEVRSLGAHVTQVIPQGLIIR